MAQPLTIEALRRELGLNQTEFAVRLGLANKASVSLIERGGPCSLSIALAIEALSGGRIDAAALNADVALSRQAVLIDPANWPDGKVGSAAGDLAEVTGIIAREQRTHGGDSAIDDPLPECAGGGVAGAGFTPHPGPAPETGRGAAAMRPGGRALSGGRG